MAEPATEVATDFAAADDPALSDLAPPADADTEAEEDRGASPGLFVEKE